VIDGFAGHFWVEFSKLGFDFKIYFIIIIIFFGNKNLFLLLTFNEARKIVLVNEA
jgi:hypothetical protein